MAALTIDDFISNGVTAAGIVAICVLVVLGVGIVGALLHPRRQ
jgi:NAD/NADP transhydrogenase alpha subunit